MLRAVLTLAAVGFVGLFVLLYVAGRGLFTEPWHAGEPQARAVHREVTAARAGHIRAVGPGLGLGPEPHNRYRPPHHERRRACGQTSRPQGPPGRRPVSCPIADTADATEGAAP